MKLILSHEYGHHYSLYYKWTVWQLPSGTRFPASYYSTRPLPYAGTAPDYSLGWADCDCEVVAEDYSYLFSGYGVSQVAATWGYPSQSIKTWFENEPLGPGGPDGSAVTPSSSTSTANPPTVSISSPANGATISGSVTFSASAADDVGLTKVGFYIDNNLISEISSAPYQIALATGNYSNGTHTLLARAYGTDGQTTDATISVAINNATADTTNPTVTITDPSDNPHTWTSGTLHIGVTATDNVAVTKIEIYINDQLTLTANAASVSATWNYSNAPAGTYTLMAKAYDSSGNTAESSIVINKS
jgi:hypothetical protein